MPLKLYHSKQQCSRLCLSLWFIFVLQASIHSHVRLVCPRPTTPASNIETTSLTFDSILPQFDDGGDVTDIEPGLFTVHFEETKFIKGSPFRILLHGNREINVLHETNGTNSTSWMETIEKSLSCLLLDHIPHNDHAVVSDSCSHKGNDYPLGVCKESSYYVTVRIPDVLCDDCLLVLQQVEIPAEHTVCDLTQKNDSISSCFVFSSYARVRIRASKAGSQRDLTQCRDYMSNMPGDWPYRPQMLFKTPQRVILTLDLLHKDLHVELPRDLDIGVIEKIEILHQNTKLWGDSIDKKAGNVESHMLTWRHLNNSAVDALKAGDLVLNIVGSKEKSTAGIIYVDEHFSEGQMRRLHDLYSPGGWLVSHKFLGPMAEDPIPALPVGICAPPAHFYVAYLHSVHITAHGIVGMTVMEDRAYISSVLHEDKEEIEVVRLMPPDLVRIPNKELNVPTPFRGVVQAAVSIKDYLQRIETEQFLKSVEVKTDKEDPVMIGELEEGMFAELRDENGKIVGMGALQFTQGQWIRIEIVLNEVSQTIEAAHILALDSQLVDISRDTIHCTNTFCCLEAIIHDMNSELLLHLMMGHAVLHVETGSKNVSGKVMVSTQRYCEMCDGECNNKTTMFTLNGMGFVRMKQGNTGVDAIAGLISTASFVLNRADLLLYCIQLENVDVTNETNTATLTLGSDVIHVTSLHGELSNARSQLSCTQVLVKNQHSLLKSLSTAGDKLLSVKLTVKIGAKTISTIQLPPVYKSSCDHSRIHVIGKNKDHWSTESVPLEDLHLVVSDNLHFILKGNTTVYIAKNKIAYESCDFDQAVEWSDVKHIYDTKNFFYKLKVPGVLYFMDKDSCNTTRPLKLTVFVAANTGDRSHLTSDQCLTSVYKSWREELLHDYSPPSVATPIVIGVLMGVLSSAVFFAWHSAKTLPA